MWKRSLLLLLVLTFLLSTSPSAKANVGYASDGQVAAVVGGIAAAGAGIGFLIYFSIHHGHSLRGCAASAPGGPQLVNERDQQSYTLVGDVAHIKTGDRVKVSGKKIKSDPSHKQFVVTKLSKDYGTCRVPPTS